MQCECSSDGYCNRYQRDMRGRFREICQGINVDIGTAAAFRNQWMADRVAAHTVPSAPTPRKLLLITDQAPGDAVAMTAAIYSLHKSHPGKFATAVQSPYPEVFQYNPNVVPADSDFEPLHMHYPAIHQSNQRGIHFMQGWCEFLGLALGIHVPLLTDRPHLFFQEEVGQEDYWVICSGGKKDFTNKQWPYYQQVVDALRNEVRFVQVGRGLDDHPRLRDVFDMVGQTDLRQLFDVVGEARGVLCGVSLLMHVAAALDKPAVVIAGGREPVAWNASPKQVYVHNVGALGCSSPQGDVGRACWRSRVVPLYDGTAMDKDTCERPIEGVPECMRMIKPVGVANIIRRYI